MVTLTVKVSGSGKVEVVGYGIVTGSQAFTIPDGSTVTFKATANSGYVFQKYVDVWPTGSFESTQNPWSDTMAANDTVTAYFVAANQPPPSSYLLNISVNLSGYGHAEVSAPSLGTITVTGILSAPVNAGETVHLKAVANPDYKFTVWTGTVSDSRSEFNVLMSQPWSFTANFEPLPPPPPSEPFDIMKYVIPGGIVLVILASIKKGR